MKRAGEPVCRRHIVSSFVHDAPPRPSPRHVAILSPYVVAESSLEEKKKGTKKKIVIISNKYYWSFECLLKEIPGYLSLASFGIGGRER